MLSTPAIRNRGSRPAAWRKAMFVNAQIYGADWRNLLLGSALNMKHNILLVDDDLGSIQLMGRILSGVGELQFATSGEDALRLARRSAPDLMLLDAELPGLSGFQVLQLLKAEANLAAIPVILVTSHSDTEFEVTGFEMGAVDFISKPVQARLLLARVNSQLRVKRMGDQLREISTTDVVTGVPNRRRFEEALELEWSRCRRSGDPLALLMIDVDHFKAFNDCYGHPAGDACLRSLAQTFTHVSLRPADLVARYGGEEFAMLLPVTSTYGAGHVANHVLDAVESLGIVHEASPTAPHVTVSIGIASLEADIEGKSALRTNFRTSLGLPERYSSLDLVEAADKALYSAKTAGRARAWPPDIVDDRTRQFALDIAAATRDQRRSTWT